MPDRRSLPLRRSASGGSCSRRRSRTMRRPRLCRRSRLRRRIIVPNDLSLSGNLPRLLHFSCF